MNWYYGLILVAVVMFGGNFALQDSYRKMRGSGLKISLESSLIGSLAGLAVLLVINGLRFELTPFTLIMAVLAALNSFGFTFCSFRALEHINLSVFSLFSMLGGMLLPFFQGLIFYGEDMTWAKGICVFLIIAALLLTVSPSKGQKGSKKGTIYYIGIFVLNGLAGVLTAVHEKSPFAKAGADAYSIWIAVCTIVISAVALLFFRKKKTEKPYSWRAGGVCAIQGVLGRLANFLLVVAQANKVDTSVQYSMVTGGVMVVSTLICFFGANKPGKREVISVVLAFLGMVALFAIPF